MINSLNLKNKIGSDFLSLLKFCSFFSSILILPIAISILASFFGYRLTPIIPELIFIHANEVFLMVVMGVLSIFSFSVFFYYLIRKFEFKSLSKLSFVNDKTKITTENFVLIVILIVSYYGLLKSFPGSLFSFKYNGPTDAWLGVGAWSVIFLFSLELALFIFVGFRNIFTVRIPIITLIFLPILFRGSRIDFLSLILSEIMAYIFISPYKYKRKLIVVASIFLIVISISFFIGAVRSSVNDNASSINSGLMTHAQFFKKSREENIFYIPNLGDIGASVYQAIDAKETIAQVSNLGLYDLLVNYSQRMLPSFLLINRPHDVYSDMRVSLGGGALHSFGEGYFFARFLGVVFVGAIFGLLCAISFYAKKFLKQPLGWIVFIAPWMVMIRSGWYQFFSFFKILELVFVIFLSAYLFNFFYKVFGAVYKRS